MNGFRILKRHRTVDPALVERFRTIPVANISDVMSRVVAAGPAIRPRHGSGRVLCGAALTVRCRPGDNVMAHAAIAMAQPGDVIVVDAGGDLTNALIGERMMYASMRRGVAGWVINGSIRDLAWIRGQDFPVYAAGVTHRGPYKDGPGEINVPIAIDGMVIAPGDLIVGDDDGVVAVPMDQAAEICEAAAAKAAQEAATFDALGSTDQAADRATLFRKLRELGCVIED